jgi:hypothetical protein
MFHVFQIYVAYVSSECCKSKSSIAYVAMAIHGYTRVLYVYVLNVSKHVLEVFHLDVAYVTVAIHVCCKCVFKCFSCFSWMLHVFIWMLPMLQWLYTYVASVCFKCFTYFRRMLQVFYLDFAYVAVVIHTWCKRMFQLFHLVLVCHSRCCSPCNTLGATNSISTRIRT